MTASAAPKQPSVWEDFIDIFISPSEVFRRREKASLVVPLLVLTVALTVLYLGTKSLYQPVMDAEFARRAQQAIQANPQLTMEQMQRGKAISDTFGVVFVVLGTPIAVVVVGIVLWLVGKLFDAKEELGTALTVTTYAYFPKILAFVAGALIAYFTDPSRLTSMYSVSVGVGKLLDPTTTSPLLLALVGRLDLFTLWVTALLGIGLSVTGRISRGSAFLAAAIVWLVGALPGLFGALRGM